jgi:hypothetical protein
VNFDAFKDPSGPWEPFSDEELLTLAAGLAESACQGQVAHYQQNVHTDLSRMIARQLALRSRKNSCPSS